MQIQTNANPNNPQILNIDAISAALFTLSIPYEYIQTQCDEGALMRYPYIMSK